MLTIEHFYPSVKISYSHNKYLYFFLLLCVFYLFVQAPEKMRTIKIAIKFAAYFLKPILILYFRLRLSPSSSLSL